MASDEIVWNIINHQHCSFKLKTTKEQTFCRNPYNLTGFCSRQACPLANSRYATVRSDPAQPGRLYLYIKTAERAHLPSKWWEKIRLPVNYTKALAEIDTRLAYWPKFYVHKSKQRLTRLTQVAIRARRLEREAERLGETVVPRLAPKIRRREATRERRAEAAAKLERTIERELVERLRSGAYGDKPINVEEGVWARVLRGLERSGEGTVEEDPDLVDEDEEEEGEFEFEREGGQVEYVSDLDASDEEGLGDLEDWIGNDVEGGVDDESADGSVGPDDQDVVDNDDDDDDEEEQDTNAKLASALQSLKRKRAAAAASSTKSSSSRGSKQPPNKRSKGSGSGGPKREILYETEEAVAAPRVLELA